MIVKTRGIVLNYIKYGDSSIISKIFTEKYGIQSFLISGVRSKNSKHKISLFQAFNLLDLVFYHKETTNLHRPIEIKCNLNYQTIHTQAPKIAIIFFLQEFLLKVLKNEHSNDRLFVFITSSIEYFDLSVESFQNFHLQFILKISDYLGISIHNSSQLFLQINKINESVSEKEIIDVLLNEFYDSKIKLNGIIRNEILKDILKYYSFYYESISEMKSIPIIREILE